jgi:hypothetical protein
MEKFIEFASKFIPNYRQIIRGATLEDILRFEQLVGHPLPQIYKEYLIHMGQENGGVELICDGSTNIIDLIEFYEEEIVTGYDAPPSHCIIIGIGGTIIEEISLQYIPIKESRVFFSGGGKIESLCAESFEKFLYRSVFTQVQYPLYPYFARLSGTDERRLVKLSHDIAVDLGFEALWFSDSIAFCGEQNNSTLSVVQGEKVQGITIKIATQQKSELNYIISTFQDRLAPCQLYIDG